MTTSLSFLFFICFFHALSAESSVQSDVGNVPNSVIPSLLPSPLPKLLPNTFVISQKSDGSQNWNWYLVGSKNSIILEMMPLSFQNAVAFDKDSLIISNTNSENLYYKSAEEAVKAVQKVKELAMKNENYIFDIPHSLVLVSTNPSNPSNSETFNAQVIEFSMTNSQQKTLNSKLRRRMKMGSFTVSAEMDDDGNGGVVSENKFENEKQKSDRTVLGFIHETRTPVSSQSFLESPNHQASTRLSIQHAISQASIVVLNHQSNQASTSDEDSHVIVNSAAPFSPSLNLNFESIDSLKVTPNDYVRAMEANVAAIANLDAEVSHIAELLVYICMLLITFAVSLIMGGVLWRKVQNRHLNEKEYMLESV